MSAASVGRGPSQSATLLWPAWRSAARFVRGPSQITTVPSPRTQWYERCTGFRPPDGHVRAPLFVIVTGIVAGVPRARVRSGVAPTAYVAAYPAFTVTRT